MPSRFQVDRQLALGGGPESGYFLRVKNNAGYPLHQGTPVVLDTATSGEIAVKNTTSGDDSDVLGVTTNYVKDGEYVNIQTRGLRGKDEGGTTFRGVRVDGTTDIAAGDQLSTVGTASYSTGTVTVAAGSATVTGSGTTFTAAMVGRTFFIDSDDESYTVASYSSGTSITLDRAYDGSQAGSGKSYTIYADVAGKATAGQGGPFAIALEAYSTNNSAGEIIALLIDPARQDSTSVTSVADDTDISFGTGTDAEIRWSTADSDNHSLVVALGNSNQAIHITDVGAQTTDWAVSADTHPTVYVHSNTTPATDYVTVGGHDGTTAHINVVGGTTLSLDVDGTAAFTVTADELVAADNQKFTLGTGNDADIYYDGSDLIVAPAVVGTGDLKVTGASIHIEDSEAAVFGTGEDATISYDGTDLIISPAAVGTGNVQISGGQLEIVGDSEALVLGAGEDATLLYDGTDLVINPAAVGSGDVEIQSGTIRIDDGGTVTQATSITTGVTLNTNSGQITSVTNPSIAAGAEATFTVTNSQVGTTDTVILNVVSQATDGFVLPFVSAIGSGSFDITLTNVDGAAVSSGTIVLSFVVIQGASS